MSSFPATFHFWVTIIMLYFTMMKYTKILRRKHVVHPSAGVTSDNKKEIKTWSIKRKYNWWQERN